MQPDFAGAARQFFATEQSLQILGDSTGFSGSRFARVETAERVWCLRCWPEDFAEERLRFIHHALGTSRRVGFGGVPRLAATADGATLVSVDRSLYDAQSWTPGSPLAPPTPWGAVGVNRIWPIPKYLSGPIAAALATFHLTAVPKRLPPTASRSLSDQLRDVVQHLSHFTSQQRPPHGGARIGAWLALLPQAVELADKLLRAHPAEAQATSVICHGDLWPAHLYAEAGRFGGFIDFECLAYGHPAADLAQLIVHGNGWQGRSAILDPYAQRRPLSRSELAILPATALLDLAGEAIWSLTPLASESRTPSGSAIHRHNLDAILPSLTALIADVRHDTGH